MPSEGQTAVGPNGQRAVFRGGQWVVVPAQQQMPADPTFPYQGAQAQAQAANTGAEAQVNQATVPAQIATANAQATTATRNASTAGLPEGFMWGPDGKTAIPIPGYSRQGISPEIRASAIQAFSDADALERTADQLEQLYREGPGSTGGIAGIQDYLPTERNRIFNDAGQQARGYVKRSLGFTGGEGNTAAESSALYDPYLPSTSNFDGQIEAKIGKLRALAEDSRRKATTVLGGVPDANGNIRPLPNPFTDTRIIGGNGPAPAEFGATTAGQPVDPQYQAEYSAWVAQNAGKFTPEQYAQFRAGLDQKYNYGATADYIAEGQRIVERLQKGGSLNLDIPPTEEPLSRVDQFRNNLISNPVGAGAAGFLDMGGFGGVTALAPDQMAALGDRHPVGMAVGQVAGAVTGTSALGRLGAGAAGRMGGLGRTLLAEGRGAQFGRNLATDTAYSGIYGGVTEGDPLSSAALGAGGSIVGQGAGKALGRVVGGLDVSPAVRYLASRKIPMTVGQRLGGFAKSVEDKAISLPLVGDMIRARRLEGLGAFNREAFGEAGSPIGATVQDIGQEGVQQLTDQIGDSYTNATAGANVPFDDQFIADMQAVEQIGQMLPEDYRRALGNVLKVRMAPLTDQGYMTGEGYQQAVRGLKGARNSADRVLPGFEDKYRETLTGSVNALESQMMRGGGENVVSGLNAANAANRNMRTIEDATTRAAGGSETGTPFMFTPSQLQRAGLKTEQRFPGPRPFAELADNAQQVLPSRVPDSGTAGRVAQIALPGALAGSGAGLGFAAGGDMQGAQTGASLSALAAAALLLGGTRKGQQALNAVLFGRGPRAEMIGRQMRKKSGLFGAASLPLALEAGS